MARAYRMTAARRAALRKAQLASARARRTGRKLNQKRKANKLKTYGSSWRSANRVQKINRVARGVNYAYAAGVATAVGATAYQLRSMNASIAYTGTAKGRNGQVFNAQGGPRILQVKPTARGARRRNRAEFRKQYGRKTLRQLKRNTRRAQRMQRRNVRNAVRYGSTTMSWGPRQQALPRGR